MELAAVVAVSDSDAEDGASNSDDAKACGKKNTVVGFGWLSVCDWSISPWVGAGSTL